MKKTPLEEMFEQAVITVLKKLLRDFEIATDKRYEYPDNTNHNTWSDFADFIESK